MAPFVPNLQDLQPKEYAYNVRTPSAFEQHYLSDTSLGKLFEGVGQIGGGVARAADENVQENLYKSASTQLSAVRDAHGADITPEQAPAVAGIGTRGAKYEAAGSDPSLTQDEVPAGVQSGIDYMKKKQEQLLQGGLSNTHYFASLQTVVSSLKAQYPGYEKQVDEAVHQITGITPANALRQSVMTDMYSSIAAQQAQANKMETHYREDMKWLSQVTDDTSFDNYRKNYTQFQTAIAKVRGREQLWEDNIKEAQAIKDRGEAQSKAYERVYQTDVDNSMASAGTIIQGIINKRNLLAGQGAELDPKELVALKAQAIAARDAIQQQLDIKAHRPLPGFEESVGELGEPSLLPRTDTVGTYVEPGKIKAIQDGALASLNTIINSLDGNTNIAGAAATVLKMSQERDTLHFFQQFPAARTISVMDKTIGNTNTGLILNAIQNKSQGGKYGFGDLTQAIGTAGLMSILDTSPDAKPAATVGDILTATKGADGSKPIEPGAMRAIITGAVQATKDQNPAVVARAVDSLYSDPQFLAKVNRADALKTYALMGTPDMAAKVKNLPPEQQQKYFTFMHNGFYQVFHNAMDEAQRNGIEQTGTNWRFNQQTLQFEEERTPNAPLMPGQTMPAAPYNTRFRTSAFNNLNQGLAILAPALKAEYGSEAAYVAVQMMSKEMNFNADKNSGIFGAVDKALKTFTANASKTDTPEGGEIKIPEDNVAPNPGTKTFDLDQHTENLQDIAKKNGLVTTGLDPRFQKGMETAISDYEQETGNTVRLSSLVRSRETQTALYRNYLSGKGGLAAPPGLSYHEVGQAADVNNDPKFLAWLQSHEKDLPRYGLKFLDKPYRGRDPGHIELDRRLAEK